MTPPSPPGFGSPITTTATAAALRPSNGADRRSNVATSRASCARSGEVVIATGSEQGADFGAELPDLIDQLADVAAREPHLQVVDPHLRPRAQRVGDLIR